MDALTQVFAEPRLPAIVHGQRNYLFQPTVLHRTFLLRKFYSAIRDDNATQLIFAELTDGYYWIPAVFSLDDLRQSLSCDNIIRHLPRIENTTIYVMEAVPGVYLRGDDLSPIWFVQKFCIEGLVASGHNLHELRDIATHPDVEYWLSEQKQSISTLDTASVVSLIQSEDLANLYREIGAMLEYMVLKFYGEVPSETWVPAFGTERVSIYFQIPEPSALSPLRKRAKKLFKRKQQADISRPSLQNSQLKSSQVDLCDEDIFVMADEKLMAMWGYTDELEARERDTWEKGREQNVRDLLLTRDDPSEARIRFALYRESAFYAEWDVVKFCQQTT